MKSIAIAWLDFELAEIYGYTTARFNEQVKNNIEKFDNDFMFHLNKSELKYLQSNFLTANISSKSRSRLAILAGAGAVFRKIRH